MSQARVLIAHDDPRVGETARDALAALGPVDVAPDPGALLATLQSEPVSLVVLGAGRDGPYGGDLLQRVRDTAPGAAIVVAGGEGGADPARAALRAGAAGYVAAPVSAGALWAAAERALAGRALERENEALRSTLHTVEISGRLLRCLDPSTVYAVASRRQRGLAHFRRPSLPSSDGLVFRGFSREEAQRIRQSLLRAEPVGHAAEGPVDVATDGSLHAVLRRVEVADPGQILCIPLSGHEREAGVIHVFGDGTPFDESEMERARVVAEYAAIALDNAERYNGAKARALIDDATGLYNFRYLLDSADHELERAARYGLELSVLFIDIDRFKQVNDHHGHLVGTATLRHVASHLQRCVRQIDTLARYGGDEFTVLLSDTSSAAARTAAERIRQAVADSVFDDGQGNAVRVTVSIGAASYPRDSGTRDELIDLADKAMYRAKSLGRDRVALAEDLDPESRSGAQGPG